MGTFGFGTVLAPALGPSVGGLLVEGFGWRAVFYFVLPFCAVCAAMTRRYLPHSSPGGVPVNAAAPRPDAASLLLLSAALAVLLVGMGRLQGAGATLGWSLLAVAAGLAWAFVARQRRAATPLLPLVLFERPVFSAAALVSVIYGATLFGSTYLLPVFMVSGLGMAPSKVGLVLLPAGLALALSIPLAGRWVDRWPHHRTVAAGLLAMALSYVAMGVVGTDTAIAWIAAFVIVGRIGLGFIIPALNIGAMRGSEPALIAAGTSAKNFLRQLGGAVGVGMVGVVLEWRLRTYGVDGALGAQGAPGTLRAFHEVFALMAVTSVLAALAARRMRDPSSSG